MNHSSSIEALESRIAPATITITLAGGLLTVKGGAGPDDVTIDSSGSGVNNVLTVTPNNPGDEIVFNTVGQVVDNALVLPYAKTVLVTKIAVDLGGGVNHARFNSDALSGPQLKAAITYKGGVDADSLHFTNFGSTAGLAATLGAGDDVVDFAGGGLQEVRFGKDVSINLGSGDNHITTTAGAMGVVPELAFEGALSIIGGDNADSIQLGVDDVDDADLTVGKALSIKAGKGQNDIAIIGDAVSLAKTTITSLADNAVTSSVSIKGLVSVKINGGLTVAAAGSVNQFDLEGVALSVSGGVTYKGGLAADTINIGAAATSLATFIGGKVSVTNGEGANVTSIGNGSGTPGTLHLGGTLTVTGGAGADTLEVEASSGSITGLLSATLGQGQSTISVIADAIHVGGLKVTASDIASATDTLTLKGVTFTKAASASLGAGASTVTIDDITALDKFTLSTGAGDDFVDIERDAARTGRSYFFGATQVNTGTGDDTVTIGAVNVPAQQAVFFAPLKVDLGAGTDPSLDFDASLFLPGVSHEVKDPV